MEELSNDEYDKIKTLKMREGKSISEIMKSYNINIEYDKINLLINLSNSLCVKSSDDEKENCVKYILKYTKPRIMKLFLVDFDKLTFSDLDGVPHLASPIIHTRELLDEKFNEILSEKDRRINLFSQNHIKSYDEFASEINLPCLVVIIEEISEILDDKVLSEMLLKLLINSEKVGIKFIMFSKFTKKHLNLGSIVDLITIYEKCDPNYLFKKTNINNCVNLSDNTMNGFDFEKYSADLLRANGFENVVITKESGDFGVDIIAYKDEIKYSIQCKKYSSPVGIKAVQEVIASKAMNDSHVAVVLTNNTFTSSAKLLAQKNNVLLWDKVKLNEFIQNYKNKN